MKSPAWLELQQAILARVPVPRGYFLVKTGEQERGDLAYNEYDDEFEPPETDNPVDHFYMVIRPKKQETKGYITTVSGAQVSLLNPKPNQIKLNDVAHHLAWKCRFNGHMNRWYSNAEHCLNCARMAGDNLSLRRKLLVHDAGEFVTGDMTTPVKRMFPDYKKFCDDFQDFMYRLFCGDHHEPIGLKVIDQRMTATEMMHLRVHKDEDITTEPYNIPKEFSGFQCMERRTAHGAWLAQFHFLFPEYQDA